MQLRDTPIGQLKIAELRRITDSRGSFARLYCDEELSDVLNGQAVVQINHSVTYKPGAIRGMHFQLPPAAELKIVRCIRGEVFDVAVDLRKGSPTFLQWHGLKLSEDNDLAFVIPPGFAHGFQVIKPNSELLYFHSAHYKPEYEGALRYDEPRTNIDWPLDVSEISERDLSHPFLLPEFGGISP